MRTMTLKRVGFWKQLHHPDLDWRLNLGKNIAEIPCSSIYEASPLGYQWLHHSLEGFQLKHTDTEAFQNNYF